MRISNEILLQRIYLIISAVQCEAFKVLVVFPFPIGSHRILGRGVVNHLLKAGHEVTYITPYPANSTNPYLRQIVLIDNIAALDSNLTNIEYLMTRKVENDLDVIFHTMINITKKTLENESVLNFLNDQTEQFDIVIAQWTFNEVFSGFAAVFNCPYIWFFPYEPNFVALSLVDEATNPAYTANINLNYLPPYTFWQRLQSLQFQMMSVLKSHFHYRNVEKEIFEKTFTSILARRNKTLPSYEELRLSGSLILGNSHVSVGQALRLPQNYIPIAGQHIEEDVPPLTKDLKKIMDQANNGVIYFSMGSNMRSKELPDFIKQNLIKMFGSLNQTVIWKFEDIIPNLPKNLHIMQWAPQQSILSHPNCILFISHGGLLSATEAIHYGVPIIGIPMFFDHFFNVHQSVDRGIAVKVDLTNNVAEDLKNAIQEMLDNSKYRERMKEVSFIYHHRPVPPGKELVHWVEHVVKTGGALHLRSPAFLLPWYQKMYLDLAALILLISFLVMYCLRQFRISQQKYQRKTKLS